MRDVTETMRKLLEKLLVGKVREMTVNRETRGLRWEFVEGGRMGRDHRLEKRWNK